MKSATQDRCGPDGIGSPTGGFRQKRPEFRYGPGRTNLGHPGPDQTDPRPTLDQTEQTQDQQWGRPKRLSTLARQNRPKTNTGPDRKDSVPGPDRADPRPGREV